MDQLFNIVPREWIEAIGWTIFHSVWQGIVVAIVLGLLLISFAKFSAHLRYIITFSSLAIMLVWSTITFALSYQKASERARIREQIISNPQLVVEHFAQSIQKNKPSTVVNSRNDVIFHIKWIVFKSKLQKQFPLIVAVWWLGLVFFLFRLMGGLITVRRMRYRNTTPVTGKWESLTITFAEKLKIKRKVVLLQCMAAKVPLTIGYLKPVILLPVSIFTGLSVSEIESIIAHELAHIARRDYFFNIVQSLIEILFFYHPAIWWISSVARTERENSCDDIAIELTGDSVNYAKALVNMQEQVIANPDFAMAFGENKNKLFKRVKRLLNQQTMKTTFKEGFIASCILFSGILLMVFLTGASVNKMDSLQSHKSETTAGIASPEDSVNNRVAKSELSKSKPEIKKDKEEILSALENMEISEDLQNELEVAMGELDDATTTEVLRGIRGALNNMDLNLIVHEALKGASAAINNMDLNTVITESMKGNDSDNPKDVDKITKEALKGANAALDEIDLNLILNEALKGAEGALSEIDLKNIINESLNKEIKGKHKKSEEETNNKYYPILSKGTENWNKWRESNSQILPDLSEINIKGLSLQHANLTNLSLSDGNIDNSDFRKADFSGMNAGDLCIKSTKLDGSEFENANLSDAKFSGNSMINVSFKYASLEDAVFKGKLQNCDFRKTNLRGTNFTGCTIEDCNFKGAVADEDTQFPVGFDVQKHGVIMER
jgi:beta-lactamase regulating signal transducer with metallopeptidase domain/uncharacterized protein YjbI with pentapeptide repeats